MTHHTLVRLLSIFATIICLGNFFPFFLSFTHEGAWEWNSLTLFDLAELISCNRPALMSYFQLLSALAVISGLLPLATGLFGSFWPQFSYLFALSITTSAIVLMSVVGLYATIMIAINTQGHRPIVQPGIGTYMTIAIITTEIVAGLISRRAAVISHRRSTIGQP
jgi:hypothetical protein